MLHASLDGVELPSVSSPSQSRISNGLASTFGIGNDVHPAGLGRGFVGSISQVRVAAGPDTFDPGNYSLQPVPASKAVLNVALGGTSAAGNYLPTASETAFGILRGRTGAEAFSAGSVTLAGGAQAVDFKASDVSLGTVVLDKGFVVETVFTPSATQPSLATLIAVGGNLFVRYTGASLQYGFSANNGGTWTDYKASMPAPAAGTSHILSVAYAPNGTGGAEMTLWLDGTAGPVVAGASPAAVSPSLTLTLSLGNEINPGAGARGYVGSFQKSRLATLVNGFVPAAFVFQQLAGPQHCDPLTLDPANYVTVTPADCDANIIAKSTLVRPTRAQMDWQEARQTAFVHFGINTFYNQEWGHGTEDLNRFSPTGTLDADSWVRTLRDNGFRYAILTVKHHDGFMSFPSRYSSYDIASTPWKDGQGDLVKDFTTAAKKYGMKVGLYMSPADSHEEQAGGSFGNGSPKSPRTIPTLNPGDDRIGKNLPSLQYDATDYGAFFLNTLYEILTQYGQVDEVWFDGAQGNIVKQETYDYPAFYDIIGKLQPQAVVAVGGRDVRWIGNESGDARANEWGPASIKDPGDGGKISGVNGGSFEQTGSREAVISAVRTGGANALHWWPTEADMKLTGGWFAHPNDVPRTPADLMGHYDKTTGRNSLMLLNVPPTTAGTFAPSSVAALAGFTAERRKAFAEDLALGLPVQAGGAAQTTITDGNGYTSWSPSTVGSMPLEVDFGMAKAVDRVSLGEDVLNHGQAAENFTVEAFVNGAWTVVAEGGSIGYNRSVTFPSVQASKIRVTVTEMRAPVHLATLSVFGKSAIAPAPPSDIYVDCSAPTAGPGPEARPFNTLEQFRQTEIAPGTTIHIKAGTVCPASTTSFWGYGTADKPITVTSYGNGAEPRFGDITAAAALENLRAQGWIIGLSLAPDVAPTTTATVGEVPASGWYTVAPAVSLGADQQGARTQYRIGGEDWLDYTAPVVIAEGTSTFDFRSVSATGLEEATRSLGELKVDLTAPSISATADTSTRTVTVQASDAGSGLASREYSLDGGSTWLEYTAPISAGNVGIEVLARARDRAGLSASTPGKAAVPALPKATQQNPKIGAPQTLHRGSEVRLELTGFEGDARIELWLDKDKTVKLGEAITDWSTGTASALVTVPFFAHNGRSVVRATVNGQDIPRAVASVVVIP